ncbi:MAG TPA: DEAD/DEAH box helicase family protein [Candidatus Xenobia bacterium]|nr:DEAD/DEAH box helicase family protein [Candidatus Xenobia bacterium]
MPEAVAQRRNRRTAQPRLPFDRRLVLHRWMLHLFEADSFEKLGDTLKDPIFEGFDEENVSRFYHVLKARLFERQELSADLLLGYDQNIVRHWQRITVRRNREEHPVFPKYFQYLALLFTEIYLDRYFRDPAALLASLNAFVAEFNTGLPEADQIKPYKLDELNKLAYWQATGSGKTLQMHVNILQYRHYLALHGRERELNRIILLTPNEGLSQQHLRELELSGMEAELFSKEGRGLFAGRSVEIIDVHKLKEEMGEKTVAIDAFEGNNLVLVDEGHRGAAGFEWMDKRNRLCEEGFSFEYSATFGQAIKAARREGLAQEYAKCILFDYSYKYFYRDGYGKDYHILNLEDDSQEDKRQLYLTACLLVFYQQLRLHREKEGDFRPYLLERPLWVFVGSSVNAVRTERGRKVSDVVDILLFLAGFVRDRAGAAAHIDRLLHGRAGLLDPKGHEIFANAFAYLVSHGETPEAIFDDILRTLFNAPATAALHVEQLKGSEGEIALRLGDNDPFGLINVGDAASLCNLCREHAELVVTDREFSGSLFHGLNDAGTTVNVLIGSKKFTEGWNSWRVSTMGLMNVGRTEGSEIIQLFGRGVRLKGYGYCLKRSPKVEEEQGLRAPKYIRPLETLHIFGIRADYMKQFKEYLEEEGLPEQEEREEFLLPVVKFPKLEELKLKIVRLKEEIDFKRTGPKPTLEPPAGDQVAVTLDWYPKIQSAKSRGIQTAADPAEKKEGKLTKDHLAFLDWEALFFELEQFKNEKVWHNLNLSRDAARRLLESPTWYKLLIPPEELEFTSFSRVRVWQEIAVALLKKYCDSFYKYKKNEYELPHLEYRELTPDDPNFFEEYRLLIAKSEETIIETLRRIKEDIEQGKLKDVQVGNLHCFVFNRHLYEPLIHIRGELIEVRPVALNEGERDFVLDLRRYHGDNAAFFKDKELYLLRNQSRGRGIGFFEAGNFYPDFILWLLVPDRQYVSFVDPKGIRNLQGANDPKIRFHEKIKELEQRLGDPKVILNSFVISVTPFKQVGWWEGGMTEKDFEHHHIFFRDAEKRSHLETMFRKLLGR